MTIVNTDSSTRPRFQSAQRKLDLSGIAHLASPLGGDRRSARRRDRQVAIPRHLDSFSVPSGAFFERTLALTKTVKLTFCPIEKLTETVELAGFDITDETAPFTDTVVEHVAAGLCRVAEDDHVVSLGDFDAFS